MIPHQVAVVGGTNSSVELRKATTLELDDVLSFLHFGRSLTRTDVCLVGDDTLAVSSHGIEEVLQTRIYPIQVMSLSESRESESLNSAVSPVTVCVGHTDVPLRLKRLASSGLVASFASCGEDGNLFMWDLGESSFEESNGSLDPVASFSRPSGLSCLTEVPQRNWIVAGGEANRVVMWDMVSSKPVGSFRMKKRKACFDLDCWEEEQTVVIGSQGIVRLWDVRISASARRGRNSRSSSSTSDGNSFVFRNLLSDVVAVKVIPEKNLLAVLHSQYLTLGDLRMLKRKLRTFRPHQGAGAGFRGAIVRVGEERCCSVTDGGGRSGLATWDFSGEIVAMADRLSCGVCHIPIGGLVSGTSNTSAAEVKNIDDRLASISSCLEAVDSANLEEEGETAVSSLIRVRSSHFDFRIPRCLLRLSSCEDLESRQFFDVDLNVSFDPSLFWRLLYGETEAIPADQLRACYDVFLGLGMLEHAFLVCKLVLKCRSVHQVSEEAKSGGLPEVSPFQLACFNRLSTCRDLPSELRDQVARHEKKPLTSHAIFQEIRPMSFSDQFSRTLAELCRTMTMTDVTLSTGDGSLRGHLAVLLRRSEFISSTFRFGGAETSSFASTRKFQVDVLTEATCATLLEYVYLDKIGNCDLRILLPLYLHAHVFNNRGLKACILQTIARVSLELKANHQFESAIGDVGSLLDDPLAFREVIEFWKARGLLSQTELDRLIERGAFIQSVETRLEEMEDRIVSSERIEAMEERLEGLEEAIKGLSSQMTELTQLLKERHE